MRKVASYSFSKPVEKSAMDTELALLDDIVMGWLEKKGRIDSEENALILADGRETEFTKSVTTSATGKLLEYRITEPTDTGLFQTAISFGCDGNELSVYADLRAGGGLNQLSPVQFDVRCPHVIRAIIDSSKSWSISETPVSTSSVPFLGDKGAQRFIQALFHPSRNLPLVAISTYEGAMLSENIASNIAKGLSGLAIVAVLDEEAAWYVTNAKGKEWSCYNGAIRLYWPIRDKRVDPYAHPLWTRFSLLSGVFDVRDASYRIRKILRRRVLGASAFSVWEPVFFNDIRKKSRKEELERLIKHAETTDDWREIADSYAKDNDALQEKIDELNSEILDLSAQVSNLQLALQWQNKEEDEILAAEAAWYVTNAKGKEWSCYNGAIRLYWPIRDKRVDPYAHPLWTRFSLLSGVFDVRDASYRIRKILRRRVLGASAFSVWEPVFFNDIRKKSRKEELERLIKHAETTDDWREIADSYAKDNDALQEKIDELNSEILDLSAQVSNLQLALQWQNKEEDEILAAEDMPPVTVADAVEKAREKFHHTLVFGDDVHDGVETLAQDAGPPEKIFQYLELLSQMAESFKHGSLGTTAIQWLKDRGANCSGESETIKNSKTENEKRRWKDGKSSRVFDTHMKPTDATSPDRCVRIYFDIEPDIGKVVIGWVGRHP